MGLTLATAGLYTIGWLASTKLHNQLIQTVSSEGTALHFGAIYIASMQRCAERLISNEGLCVGLKQKPMAVVS